MFVVLPWKLALCKVRDPYLPSNNASHNVFALQSQKKVFSNASPSSCATTVGKQVIKVCTRCGQLHFCNSQTRTQYVFVGLVATLNKHVSCAVCCFFVHETSLDKCLSWKRFFRFIWMLIVLLHLHYFVVDCGVCVSAKCSFRALFDLSFFWQSLPLFNVCGWAHFSVAKSTSGSESWSPSGSACRQARNLHSHNSRSEVHHGVGRRKVLLAQESESATEILVSNGPPPRSRS